MRWRSLLVLVVGCGSDAETAAADPQVAADVRAVVGGHFTVDAIGPDAHSRVVERVRARPDVYARALTPPTDPDVLANGTPEALFDLTAADAPDATRGAADRWIAALGAAHWDHPELRERLARQAHTAASHGRGLAAPWVGWQPGWAEIPTIVVEVELTTLHGRTCTLRGWDVWTSTSRYPVAVAEPVRVEAGTTVRRTIGIPSFEPPEAIVAEADCTGPAPAQPSSPSPSK